jgi:Tol biopolymer transport system component
MRKSKTLISLAIMALTYCNALHGQENRQILTGEYLGQEEPKLQSEIFAPGIVSKVDEYEFGSVFSKDGSEFYYGVDVDGKAEIRHIIRIDNKWSEPKKIDFNGNYSYNDPFLSPDGNKLYFISDMPLTGSGNKKDIDIWYATRKGDGWSEPINAGKMINSEKDEYYISFSKGGTIYFASNAETNQGDKWNFDIYYSELKEGVYQKPQKMCDRINTVGYEADVFISPDERYIIFCSSRKDGYGQGDLYISFKKNNKWSKAVNMGESINSEGHELCPFVTDDGKYFFYTSNKDIYWVDAGIIESYRNNNL